MQNLVSFLLLLLLLLLPWSEPMLPTFHMCAYVCIKWFALKYMSLVFAFCHRFPCAHTSHPLTLTLYIRFQVTHVMVADKGAIRHVTFVPSSFHRRLQNIARVSI